MKICIKNMVCPRCITAVQSIFASCKIMVNQVELGNVSTVEILSAGQLNDISIRLQEIGFEIITNKKDKIVQQIKNEIISIIYYSDNLPITNLSVHLSNKLGYEYNYLSNIFSETENTTVEKYFISQRIEKVKELLTYNELTITQIADKLGYSSAAYLSSQFKNNTGYTPTQFIAATNVAKENINNL